MRSIVLILSGLALLLLLAIPSVQAGAPVVNEVTINPQEAEKESDTEINFNGQAEDPEGEPIGYFYWNSSIEGVLYEGEGEDLLFQQVAADFAESGNHSITLQVRAGGEWSEVTENATSWLNLSAPPPKEPDANIILNPPQIHLGEPVSFVSDVTIFPPAKSIDKYNWTMDGEFLSNQESFSDSDFTVGEHNITLVVTDDQGLDSMPAEAVLEVLPPIPNAIYDGFSPDPAKASENVTLTGHGVNNNGDNITCNAYEWQIKQDDVLLFTVSGQNPVVNNFTEGNYLVRFRVLDENDTYSMWVEADLPIGPANEPPVATITWPTSIPGHGTWFYTNRMLTFSASTSEDPDGTIEAWRWLITGTEVSTTEDYSATFTTEGFVSIRLEVWDDGGAMDYYSTSFKVVHNTQPTAVIDQAEPVLVPEGGTLWLNGSGVEAEGAIVAYQWYMDGVLFSTDATNNLTDLAAGAHLFNFRVKDDGGLWSDNETVTITVEGTPEVLMAALTATPTAAEVGVDITFSASGSTGNIANYTFDFGDGTTEVRVVPTITHAFTTAKQYDVIVTVTANDGSTASATFTVTITGDDGTPNGPDDDAPTDDDTVPALPLLAVIAGLLLVARRQR